MSHQEGLGIFCVISQVLIARYNLWHDVVWGQFIIWQTVDENRNWSADFPKLPEVFHVLYCWMKWTAVTCWMDNEEFSFEVSRWPVRSWGCFFLVSLYCCDDIQSGFYTKESKQSVLLMMFLFLRLPPCRDYVVSRELHNSFITSIMLRNVHYLCLKVRRFYLLTIGKNGTAPSKSIPLVCCGDLNSLPESGVVEFLDNGRVRIDHGDFLDMKYDGFLSRLSNGKNGEKCGDLTHCFKLQRAYSEDQMSYSNLTYSFTGVIDYIHYTSDLLVPLGVLGSVSQDYIKGNKIIGWPHPHFPSDHQSLLVEFEALSFSNGVPVYGYIPSSHHPR